MNTTERVTIIENDGLPLILVAPHGNDLDDENTGCITKIMAQKLNCFAVINNGFRRASKVDVLKDEADCNNVEHCHEDVVKEEFLDPLMAFVYRCVTGIGEAHILTIHGLGSKARQVEPNLDIVIGYGAGRKTSMTAEQWQLNSMFYLMEKNGLSAYKGKAGGKYAGASRNNLNQLYRQWYGDLSVQSMQLEIVGDIRCDLFEAKKTASALAKVVDEHMSYVLSGDQAPPKSFAFNWEKAFASSLEF